MGGDQTPPTYPRFWRPCVLVSVHGTKARLKATKRTTADLQAKIALFRGLGFALQQKGPRSSAFTWE